MRSKLAGCQFKRLVVSVAALASTACATKEETEWELLRGESSHLSGGGIFDNPLPVRIAVIIDGVPATSSANFSDCEKALGIDSYESSELVEDSFQHLIEDSLVDKGVTVDDQSSTRILYNLLLIDIPHKVGTSPKEKHCFGRIRIAVQNTGRIGLGEDGPIIGSNSLIDLFNDTELFYSKNSNVRSGFNMHIAKSTDRMAKTLAGAAKKDCEKFNRRPDQNCAMQLDLELSTKRDALQCDLTDEKRAQFEADIVELETQLSDYPPLGEVSERFTVCLEGEDCSFCDRYERD